MDSHAYFEDFEAKERFGRFNREAEQWRLARLGTSQNDGHREPWFPARSATGLRNPLIAWIGRPVGSIKVSLSDARARWVASRKPREQCC
jgi:hypothetical protein